MTNSERYFHFIRKIWLNFRIVILVILPLTEVFYMVYKTAASFTGSVSQVLVTLENAIEQFVPIWI